MRSKSFGSVKIFWPVYRRDRLIEVLQDGIGGLARSLPLVRVVLFGSWAKGRATAFSDVDLLLIYEDPARSDAYQVVREFVDVVGLEPHLYTVSEAAAMSDTIEVMTQSGVELWPPREATRPAPDVSQDLS